MRPSISVAQLFHDLAGELELAWLAGHDGGERLIESSDGPPLGGLDLVHPHPIQVLDPDDLAYLATLGRNSFDDTLRRLFSPGSVLVVAASGPDAPLDVELEEALRRAADRRGVALFGCRLTGAVLRERLGGRLEAMLSKRLSLHGVYMEVLGQGVLITGVGGSGKSELALELISRGHRLIADDVAEFRRDGERLPGTCPELLRDFMEVRGLGILNIRAMFGDTAICAGAKHLDLIVHLECLNDRRMQEIDRLRGSRRRRPLLGLEVVELSLPVAAGRNLAVLVETAVRDHIIKCNGYDAAEDFIGRQRQMIEEQGR